MGVFAPARLLGEQSLSLRGGTMRRVSSRGLRGCGVLALGLVLITGSSALAQARMRPVPKGASQPVPLRPPGSNNQPGLAADGLLSPSGAAGSLDTRGQGTGSFATLSGRGQPTLAGVPNGAPGASPPWSPYGVPPYANPYAYPSPFAVSPYAYSPYGGVPPYGSPFGAFNPYGALPYGAANPFGAFGGLGTPFGGVNPPLGGVNPALGGVNPLGQ
jgi:hypothetical protein